MRFKLRKCVVCGSYTLMNEHCGAATKFAHPARWSPSDKWARYRRIARGLA
ncbi:MAG: nucleolar RNA-binding Nop10p family protein [Candidatus Micrarchaeia archaeon]